MSTEYSRLSTFTLAQIISLQEDLRLMRNDPDDGELTQHQKWINGRTINTHYDSKDEVAFSALGYDEPAERAYDRHGRLKPIIPNVDKLLEAARKFINEE